MLVRGLSTAEIAATLWLSSYTVRDHVKAVFGKLGVRSRPELTALLFHEHHAAGHRGQLRIAAALIARGAGSEST
jgi:DNA-binding NarL/FixJ family response regulator